MISLPSGVNIDTISPMASIAKIVDQMRREPANVRFGDLKKVCEEYFGKAAPIGHEPRDLQDTLGR